MKKYNRYNFFKHTYCEWQEISRDFIKGRTADYKSKSGSEYFFDEKGVARLSDHWGRAANCRWKFMSQSKKNGKYYIAYATWNSFFPNNENEPLYVIVVEKEKKDVTFVHKYCLKDSEAVLWNAVDAAKRIAKIKEILQTDVWFKYFREIEIEKARDFLIQGLVGSKKNFVELRKELVDKSKIS